jgi:hypothetical protein
MGRYNCHFPGDATGETVSKLSVDLMIVIVSSDKIESIQESINSRRDEILKNASILARNLSIKVLKFLEKN